MKLLFGLFLTLLVAVLSATDTDAHSPYALPALRRHYRQAAENEEASRRFHLLMRGYTQRDAVVLAYKAASEAIMAKHTGGVFDKLDRVKAASQQFDAAVALNPKHPEVRFLRFSIESNLPKFLGASKHLDEDRALLTQALLRHPQSGLDAEGFRIVRDFMLTHNHIGGPEAAKLRQLPE
ncbi:hypothetical protein [Hymenobacter latericus]|uniref:hypothetical protein n=1 Tax=Hymenobacter sp. YIM 151858-1 TaxID=2987688 RepID=UPI0022263B16|nr:hypothetical protein [Hymenobacter sp. YIM 151858-1]UYZ60918.1 hypothetical protein OIS50_08960 [Hymenobacter sp. YIM 151858-1]